MGRSRYEYEYVDYIVTPSPLTKIYVGRRGTDIYDSVGNIATRLKTQAVPYTWPQILPSTTLPSSILLAATRKPVSEAFRGNVQADLLMVRGLVWGRKDKILLLPIYAQQTSAALSLFALALSPQKGPLRLSGRGTKDTYEKTEDTLINVATSLNIPVSDAPIVVLHQNNPNVDIAGLGNFSNS